MVLDGRAIHGMTLTNWLRTDGVRLLARARGFKIPSFESVVYGSPVQAIVNHGRWIALCPAADCPGGAELVWRERPLLFCMACGNRSVGGQWRLVVLPENAAEIEASLAPRPKHEQGWVPDPEPLPDEPDDEIGDDPDA